MFYVQIIAVITLLINFLMSTIHEFSDGEETFMDYVSILILSYIIVLVVNSVIFRRNDT
ncbi:hypothetical protein VIBNISOn1_680009 [Vibrio nigripulchritudo SOn1]|uniref:Uncharacterized protein n=1 Tax=Vibrio nigripulchritudo SOn1 TaxID=1238450 RepID=A0AAV2VW68_9VIBR|nr:hypothetical protein VIBNISFn118_1450007 [Vibrio nigripulchritudo SFn118]CCO48879.1 hypothetical protein VIBNISOn1_680009 [Vibrio nigripulchritudo SOn1]